MVLGGALVASFGVSAVAFVLGPSRQREHAHLWVRLRAAERAEAGRPALFNARIERTDGWRTTEEELSFYVAEDPQGGYAAFSTTCSHLGCRVRWADEERRYFCPCHNASFDEQGLVISGPPPRPLDRFEVKEEDGELLVHWDD
jgi:menaquinol-cytochrome c reductase iron-sulfur subunit